MKNWPIALCSAVVFLFAANGGYARDGAAASFGAGALKSASPLPAPTGPYAVGRTEFVWTDKSRPDPQDPSGYREIAVWVWYPASPMPGAQPARWLPGPWSQFIAAKDPKLASRSHASVAVLTHAYSDAALASVARKYPVLLFEPGFSVVPLGYAALTENAASHGYIVVGITPTYYTSFSVLANGFAVTGNHDEGPEDYPFWGADMIFALNQLVKLNSAVHSPFDDRLDLMRVGAFGHSFGGATSLEVLKEDPRVRAAIDLDGVLFQDATYGDVSETGVHKPLLIFRHRASPVDGVTAAYRRKTLMYGSVMRSGDPGYLLTLNRSIHPFFSDFAVISEDLGIPTETPPGGLIEPARALAITNAYVVAFFDRYLKEKKSPLLNGPSPTYPEVHFETNGRRAGKASGRVKS